MLPAIPKLNTGNQNSNSHEPASSRPTTGSRSSGGDEDRVLDQGIDASASRPARRNSESNVTGGEQMSWEVGKSGLSGSMTAREPLSLLKSPRNRSKSPERPSKTSGLMFPGQKKVKSFPDGGRYEGEWKYGTAHGQGSVRYGEGGSLHCPPFGGSLKARERDGFAALPRPSRRTDTQPEVPKAGDRLIGDWRRGFAHGPGTMKYANGDTYTGSFHSGRRQGRGSYTWADGKQYYVGSWDGWENGKGYRKYANGDSYKGRFRFGERSGKGVTKSRDGTRHSGQYHEGRANGPGKDTAADGTMYTGEYQCGLEHGKGSMLLNTGQQYGGEWEEGRPHGFGVFRWNEGSEHQGLYRKGTRHGQGTRFWSNGDIYTGEFINGLPDGYGVIRKGDGPRRGEKYTGEFLTGMPHGRGTLEYGNEPGKCYKGQFKWGKMCGEGVLKLPNGDQLQQVYQGGLPTQPQSPRKKAAQEDDGHVEVGTECGRVMRTYLDKIRVWRTQDEQTYTGEFDHAGRLEFDERGIPKLQPEVFEEPFVSPLTKIIFRNMRL